MEPEELFQYNAGMFATLDPRVQQEAELWMKACWVKLWYFKVISARRTVLQQTWLYAQGRTRPGPIITDTIFGSKHLKGLAVDILPTGGGSYADIEAVGTPFGISRPLAHIPGLEDEDHYEFTVPVIPEEPVVILSPQERLKGLMRRLSITTDQGARKVLQFTIDQLKKRLHL